MKTRPGRTVIKPATIITLKWHTPLICSRRVMLREELLKLLEEDKEFRLAVAGFLGYREVLERLKEHDRKFNEILAELREHRKILEEHSRRFEEHDRKFNEILGELRVHSKILEEHTRKLGEHDRKFNEILGEIHKLREDFTKLSIEMSELREDFTKLSRRVEVTVGSVGRRWGFDLEKTVLEIFREVLEKKGIEPGRVEKFRFRDVDGRVTGMEGRVVDVDILVRDDRVYVIEVKSRAELEHVELLPGKARVVEKVLGRPVAKTLIVAVNIDREAYERARELGIETVYGNILE